MKKCKVLIPKEKLFSEYITERKSLAKIANLYSCNPETIRRRLIESGINRRFREIKVNIPLNEVRRLYKQDKLSTIEIAKKYNCSPWTIRSNLMKQGIKLRDCNSYHRWKSPANQIKPLLNTSPEIAYILGIYLGDGWTYNYKNNYFIGLDTIDYEFAYSFFEALKKIKLNPCIFKKKNRDIWRMVSSSKMFFNWINRLAFSKIIKIAEQHPKQFIKGIYESEGCLSNNYDKRVNKSYLSIILVSAEKRTILLTKRLIEKLGYHPRLNLRKPAPPRKPIWVLTLNKQNEIISFFNQIKPVIKNLESKALKIG